MKTRILTSIVGIGALAVVLYLFNTPVYDSAVALFAIIAVHEIFSAVGFDNKQWYLYAPMVPFTFVVMLAHDGWARTAVMPLAMCLLVYYAVVLITHINSLQFSQFASFAAFSGMVLLSFYSLVAMKITLPEGYYRGEAIYFVLLIFCIAWGGDTFAYFTGTFLGKHKLIPTVSPKKTVEGAIGGILGSVLCALLLTFVFGRLVAGFAVGARTIGGARLYAAVVILAAVGSVLGMIGDLLASVIKRQHGIKDYGTFFPGHGGVMDRFDSLMFVAPFVTTMVISVYYFLLS